MLLTEALAITGHAYQPVWVNTVIEITHLPSDYADEFVAPSDQAECYFALIHHSRFTAEFYGGSWFYPKQALNYFLPEEIPQVLSLASVSDYVTTNCSTQPDRWETEYPAAPPMPPRPTDAEIEATEQALRDLFKER